MDDHPQLLPGTVLDGSYRLVERLMATSVGTLWRARHEEVSATRPVLVEIVPRSAHWESGRIERIVTAIRDAHAVEGSHILRTVEARVLEDPETIGVVYEGFEGAHVESLSARIAREGGLPHREVLRIAGAIAEALSGAHRVGAVHGAVSADRVLVDAADGVALFGFGIAGAFAEEPANFEARQDVAAFVRLVSEAFSAKGRPPGLTAWIERWQASGASAAEAVDSLSRLMGPADENVQFTVYRPNVIEPARWYALLAFAHLSERREGAPADDPDPVEAVTEEAARRLDAVAPSYKEVTQDSSMAVPLDGQLTFVPEVAGLEFNPARASFHWLEPVHCEEFRMRVTDAAPGQTARGRVAVFLGSILIAEIHLAVRVAAKHEPSTARSDVTDTARPYRKIFAAYSHKDLAIVEEFEHYVRALGDEYLRDWITLRSGEVWTERIVELIAEADVFQLFWSHNSMRSEYVRREWEYALSLGRPSFVRPTYWEDPLPALPEANLPPETLRALHFHRVLRETRDAGIPVDVAPVLLPSLTATAIDYPTPAGAKPASAGSRVGAWARSTQVFAALGIFLVVGVSLGSMSLRRAASRGNDPIAVSTSSPPELTREVGSSASGSPVAAIAPPSHATEAVQRVGAAPAPAAAAPAAATPIDATFEDALSHLRSDDVTTRRQARAMLTKLATENGAGPLVDAILPDDDADAYRVNLGIAVALGNVKPHWLATEGQAAQVRALKESRSYKDKDFKNAVDKAVLNAESTSTLLGY